MFKRADPELERLQRELMAVEEEDFDEDVIFNAAAAYGRSSPKRFEDEEFFDRGFESEEVLLKKDYKRKGGGNFLRTLGYGIIAAVELYLIIRLLAWVASWAL